MHNRKVNKDSTIQTKDISMKLLFVLFFSVLLLALSMHTLLQFVHWELAMRIIGVSISIIAFIAALTFLSKSEVQGDLS